MEEWLKKKKNIQSKLKPHVDLNSYFSSEEIARQKLAVFSIGEITITSEKITVTDPLVYMDRNTNYYLQKVPTGKFPIYICAAMMGDYGDRYVAVKLEFSDKIASRYEEALIGNEDLDNFEEGDYFGFFVDAGLGTIVDENTINAYCDFEEEWDKNNPNAASIYDDYFSEIFENSYKKYPEYQREDGDWINWTIPNTEFQVPMFQSGFGDGLYPVYFGYDENNEVVNLIIHFIDLELFFSEE
ncbi:MAG: DUF4241 domain-containing protein [Methanobrevibacter sp.]|nr:DUF4241 domain-containing protein [Methanobrevibacter sp.]